MILSRRGDSRVADTLDSTLAPIAQGIEHCPPEAGAAVRICLGAHHESAVERVIWHIALRLPMQLVA